MKSLSRGAGSEQYIGRNLVGELILKIHGCPSVCLCVPAGARQQQSVQRRAMRIVGCALSRTTQMSRHQKGTRSSAIAEGPRDASCQ